MNVDLPNYNDFQDNFIHGYFNFVKDKVNRSTNFKDVYINYLNKNEEIKNKMNILWTEYVITCKIYMNYEFFVNLSENMDKINLYVLYLMITRNV
jgi:hypothetical protein